MKSLLRSIAIGRMAVLPSMLLIFGCNSMSVIVPANSGMPDSYIAETGIANGRVLAYYESTSQRANSITSSTRSFVFLDESHKELRTYVLDHFRGGSTSGWVLFSRTTISGDGTRTEIPYGVDLSHEYLTAEFIENYIDLVLPDKSSPDIRHFWVQENYMEYILEVVSSS